MEPKYSEWKALIDAYNRKKMIYCPYCDKPNAYMMQRYVTNRDGETERQYRVECPVCNSVGKVYMHTSTAELSWNAREQDKPLDPEPQKKMTYHFVKDADE